MFKMQTDRHNFRKNVATDAMYILRKMNLKYQKFKYDIWCKIAFCFLCYKLNSLELRGQWGTSISDWIRLYASIFLKS